MSPTRICPGCERKVPVQVETGIGYCVVCDKDLLPQREPDEEEFVRVYTPLDAAKYLVAHFDLPDWMAGQILSRCRIFGEPRR